MNRRRAISKRKIVKPTRKGSRDKRSSSHSLLSKTLDRAFDVLSDMRSNPSLTITQAARNRKINPRSVRRLIPSGFRKDSSGRIKARPTDRLRRTLYIPSSRPGVIIPVPTTKSSERQLVGRWMAALNLAGRNDFSKMKKFPRGQVVGGVRLATGTNEVQRILKALAEEEAPFEGLYRSFARPS